MGSERAYWLAWSQIRGVGPVLLKRIAQQFELLENAWKATAIALGQVDGLGGKLIAQILEQRSAIDPALFLDQHLQNNPNFWTPADPDYPLLLWEIPSPPPVLYYRGQVNLAENHGKIPSVGIVGTRYPTEHGSRWTRKISQALAQREFTVISGLAAGIDAMAHSSCLRCQGRTIAVLGTGLDIIYPPQNKALFEQMAAEGLILSEYATGTRPDRGNFPARNRIIAGLSRAVLVMEAPPKSGALITAKYANEFNRDVFTLPNSPDVKEAHGCLNLIHNGAEVILSERQLLESLGAIPQLDQDDPPTPLDKQSPTSPRSVPPPPASAPPVDLDPALQKLLQAIAAESTSLDHIVVNSGMETGQVSAGLLQLELLGLVSQQPGMRYQRL